MKRINYNQIIQALVLIRIGQDLGTDSQLARTVHDIVDTLATILGALGKI